MHYHPLSCSKNGKMTIEVLPPYTQYWQTRIGTNAISNGDVWSLTSLYGGDPPPRSVALISPASGRMVGEDWLPTFSWSVFDEESGADDYRVMVADNPFFVDPHIDAVVTTESYEHDAELPDSRVYYWKVVARNEHGDADPFPFPTFSFYTGSSVPETLYVDADAAPGGSGADWSDALNSLHSALTGAGLDGADVSEIRVAQGIYRPDGGTEDREVAFELASGTHLLGGFAGIGAQDPNARDIEAFETTLSGDLLGNDQPGFVNIEDNSLHVVSGSLTDETTVLDGFTITAGNADGPFMGLRGSFGAGMAVWFGSPEVTLCKFLSNWALFGGGGVSTHASEVSIGDSVFDGNLALIEGGGVRIDTSELGRVTNCTFMNNRSNFGGGMAVQTGAPWIVNCLFAGNLVVDGMYGNYGGGFAEWFGSSSTLVNCTFVDNQAETLGGAISIDSECMTSLVNCILWNNSAPFGPQAWVGNFGGGPSTLTVSYSDVMAGQAGVYVEPNNTLIWADGNIDADPLFVGPDNGDFRLTADSPCINAGDPDYVPDPGETDLEGHARVLCDRVDMGAYEFGIGDYDCNRVVDLFDFSNWEVCFTGPGAGPYAEGCEAFDFDGDRDVDFVDFSGFQRAFTGP